MPANKSSRLVSLPQAAEMLGVTTRTLRRYIADGRLSAYRLGPRMLRVDLDELDALLRPLATTKRGA